MKKYNNFSNIIFDFGGVLININPEMVVNQFKALGLKNTNMISEEYKKNGLFDKLEKGSISPQEFRDEIRKHLPQNVTDKQIDDAWNAMLLDLPYERLELLKQLRKNHKIYLLSNTNIIHWECYTKYVLDTYGEELHSFFDNDYYSHNMNLRKPDKTIYTTVLEKEQLDPAETLFIDDMLQNVEAARSVGMHAHFLDIENGETILDLF